MNILLDTNVLGRMTEPGHVQHQLTVDAVATPIGRGDSPSLCSDWLPPLGAGSGPPPRHGGRLAGCLTASAQVFGSMLVTASTQRAKIPRRLAGWPAPRRYPSRT